MLLVFFFFNDTATTEIYTLSLHDALPISAGGARDRARRRRAGHRSREFLAARSEEHTSELQSQSNLVCRLLLEKKKKKTLPAMAKTQTVDNTPTQVVQSAARTATWTRTTS